MGLGTTLRKARAGGMRSRREDTPLYLISIAADLAGLHPRTLRIYEEKGLLAPRRRNRIRLYSDRDIERVRLIRHLTQELGVNLAGVKLLLEVYDREEAGRSGDVTWIFSRRSVRVRRSGVR
jgi:MerR family transcriptional regulator/heat shock protein HspR